MEYSCLQGTDIITGLLKYNGNVLTNYEAHRNKTGIPGI